MRRRIEAAIARPLLVMAIIRGIKQAPLKSTALIEGITDTALFPGSFCPVSPDVKRSKVAPLLTETPNHRNRSLVDLAGYLLIELDGDVNFRTVRHELEYAIQGI